MAVGIDDFYDEDFDDPIEEPSQQVTEPQTEELEELEEQTIESPSNTEDDFISQLLKSRGIEDSTKIQFENEEGNIEEIDWNSLSTEDKLNILETSSIQPETGLDDSEIQLINAIRSSQLSPQEYIQYIQKQAVDNYNQNSNQSIYKVDDYTDDEIFVMDLISKSEDITEEEAIEALERAKSNETLYKKQINAMRNEYKKIEDEQLANQKAEQEQLQQEQFNQFASSIENSIINFTEFQGYDLNMEEEDMQNLYEFITGKDNAGNSWFGKALNDPDTVVQMAWFVLNGEKMIQDITEYYNKEITNVRKASYEKGKKDAENKKSTVTYKPKFIDRNEKYEDLDEDF